VIYETDNIMGDKPLFYKTWGIFGYSAYEDRNYKKFLSSLGFSGIRRFTDKDMGVSNTALKTLGITKVISNSGLVVGFFPETNLDLFNIDGKYIIKENGHFNIYTTQSKNIIVDTKIRNYPDGRLM
jgi:hypothetical protein